MGVMSLYYINLSIPYSDKQLINTIIVTCKSTTCQNFFSSFLFMLLYPAGFLYKTNSLWPVTFVLCWSNFGQIFISRTKSPRPKVWEMKLPKLPRDQKSEKWNCQCPAQNRLWWISRIILCIQCNVYNYLTSGGANKFTSDDLLIFQ